MKKYGFTLVELLGVIIVLGVIALITFPIINESIRKSKENSLEQVINNIEKAAYEYSIKNELVYSGIYNKIELSTLIDSGILKESIINPVSNEQMQGCVLYKWLDEYNQFEFKYDEECNITVKSIYDTVIEQFPYLETNGNGCVTSKDNNYSYMGGCYLKGNPTNNYIWYSGFLWRIMGINSDRTIRMITDENVTAIPWGAGNTAENWDGSYAKDWLNNYFYPKLRGNDIIVEQIWCSEEINDSASSRKECKNNLSKEKSTVGLITSDEYNLANGRESYLNIGQIQWTMTPYNSSNAWLIHSDGYIHNSGSVSISYGLRVVINVNSDVIITSGNGNLGTTWSSEVGPYVLNEDKNVEVTGKLNEKATSGEYVMFAGKKYRVVDKDSDGNTKLILDGYYEENLEYGDDNVFSITTGIGQKLNTDVLNWLINNNDIEKNKLVSNYTWYQNEFYNDSYRVSLNEENPTRSISTTVGLIRIGEMLSSQSSSILTKGYTTISSYSNANDYWTMTPTPNNSYVHGIYSDGSSPWYDVSDTLGLRVVIVINSNVTITSGNGTWSNPYQI